MYIKTRAPCSFESITELCVLYFKEKLAETCMYTII